MLTCSRCKDEACPDMGSGGPGCEDFTSEAIEEEPTEWLPTLGDYNELKALYNALIDEIDYYRKRIEGYENAVAELVRWAQGDETL